MLRPFFSILAWLLELFNAPPRATMTHRQKLGRMLLVSGTLIVLCILVAMAGTVGLFVAEKISRALDNIPDLWTTLGIFFVGITVNAGCVYLLFQVKKLDRNLMRGAGETPTRS
ncbi:MAG: hypothetical protein LV481_04170 [Methylacidiphilales bacterium]|nr:hypothetical protein [Candidatus Methylacidiphilales bacterium]